MSSEKNENTLEKRIIKTLEITEERGYNLTIEKLSNLLIGGKEPISKLKNTIRKSKKIEFS